MEKGCWDDYKNGEMINLVYGISGMEMLGSLEIEKMKRRL